MMRDIEGQFLWPVYDKNWPQPDLLLLLRHDYEELNVFHYPVLSKNLERAQHQHLKILEIRSCFLQQFPQQGPALQALTPVIQHNLPLHLKQSDLHKRQKERKQAG